MILNRRAMGAALLGIALVGCTSGASPAASSVAEATRSATARPTASPTARPTATPTAKPAALSTYVIASRIVSRLDELELLAVLGDGEKTADWGLEEGRWVSDNLDSLLDLPSGLEYSTNVVALLSKLSDGSDQTAAIAVLVLMRDGIAAAAGLVPPAAAPTPTPAPTPAPTAASIYPKSYATLSSRDWARVVKAPDNYKGNGYKLWGCITQFDGATGSEAFLAQASYRKEDYWYSDGENAIFTGDADGLAPFVENDIVAMDVMSLGSISYDTQIGGNTTVPSFLVMKIVTKGSC
jgi:hypothetical protein